MSKTKTYLAAHRVGYVDLAVMETLHGAQFREFIEQCARNVGRGGRDTGEINCSQEDLAASIEEEISEGAVAQELVKMAEAFDKKCRAMDVTGDLILFG